ncbi:alanyl-tRNA synthetase [Brevibacterium sanguinis]|uniref:Alanine--tRNA ligase n=2 Tax=Brevibacterium TaxID=1696 RepID=A0A366IHK6_9MICO|nr:MULTISPECIES: alanine--tRNA ligase [Brevibacterium]RBP61571.1 alanyl-tRNA synthetase [Brevibacterium sanguinis]RBP70823.1 alanyl-tRNA synthetase [Brevibacterium celere]
MKTAEIKQRWLDYFEANGHAVVPSASVISSDPSILFNIAGMVQFIPYLTGREPAPFPRATSVQKCVRTGDIEEVGKTTRHGTFFQMNGNFSFGDYFKREAIRLAWGLLTNPVADGGLGFDPDLLWATVHEDDLETIDLWLTETSIPRERIQTRWHEDNFWHTGQPGPGGYCSEIYYDRGPDYGVEGGPVADEDRYIEIWNLVFMEFELSAVRSKVDFDIAGELPAKNIDTGMGLERVAFLLQGVENMYEIDEVFPVIEAASRLSGHAYGANHDEDVQMRVVADHVRSALIIIGDGVRPGNEGRGYILRRLLRRAVRAMRLLGVTTEVLPELLPVSMEAMKSSYPELETDFDRISRIAYAEEKAFLRTLESGTQLFENAAASLPKGERTLSGDIAFALHDTHGFPIDLTLEMAAEHGVSVDEEGFRSLMAEQRRRAKADAKAKKGGDHTDLSAYSALLEEGAPTFVGYDQLDADSRVRGIVVDGEAREVIGTGETADLILDLTPFYAESGGQRADIGLIKGDGFSARVLDVQNPIKGLPVHRVEVLAGEIRVGSDVLATVDHDHRFQGSQAHTATHLVHAALREILGSHAVQAGSLNQPGYMRFDYSFPEAPSPQMRAEIEDVANLAVRSNYEVGTEYLPFDVARKSGAMALFGEKYPNVVRVVDIGGPFSRELCGGTHVAASSEVGPISVLSEASVGSGVRRIEAAVGMDAFRSLAAERTIVSSLSEMLKVPGPDVRDRVSDLMTRLKDAEKEIARLRSAQLLAEAGRFLDSAQRVGSTLFVVAELGEVSDAGDIRTIVTDLRSRVSDQSAVVLGVGVSNGKPVVVIATTPGAREAGIQAGKLVGLACRELGGGGGGKPDLAQGGGSDVDSVPAAIGAVKAALQ